MNDVRQWTQVSASPEIWVSNPYLAVRGSRAKVTYILDPDHYDEHVPDDVTTSFLNCPGGPFQGSDFDGITSTQGRRATDLTNGS
jgi:hypothetical protein